MGKGKTMTIYPWLTAMQYGREGNIEYTEQMPEEDWSPYPRKTVDPLITIGKERTLPDKLNQEQVVIRKDLIENLSKNAKFVICLILGPNEKQFKNEKYSSFSKLKIREHLLRIGWESKQVNLTYMELKEFVTALED